MKTKYFDNKLYETEKNIKTAFIILVLFLLGMYIGLAINYLELQNKEQEIRTLQVELVDKNQSLDRIIKEKEDLETKLNNYTIEERRNNNGT